MANSFSTTQTDPEMFKFLQHRNNTRLFPEGKEALDYWDLTAKKYDDTYRSGISFKHVIIGTREFDKCLKEVSRDVRIADLGAGTGLVGQRLKEEYGFTNITAFDLSNYMV